MEYWMIPSSIIYVWKEERPEKPAMATKIVKNWYYWWKSNLKIIFFIPPTVVQGQIP
jgi:hypothetical protein